MIVVPLDWRTGKDLKVTNVHNEGEIIMKLDGICWQEWIEDSCLN